MTCPSCIALPVIALGVTLATHHIIIGLLLTILSSSIYLHYKQFKKCTKCV